MDQQFKKALAEAYKYANFTAQKPWKLTQFEVARVVRESAGEMPSIKLQELSKKVFEQVSRLDESLMAEIDLSIEETFRNGGNEQDAVSEIFAEYDIPLSLAKDLVEQWMIDHPGEFQDDPRFQTESAGLYGPFTVTINTGERPTSRTKTKKFKREDDAILWAEDWLEDFPQYVFATAEVTDPAGNVVWTTNESVAEGVEVVDHDSDLDQQVFTLNVDGKRVSFTYWDYENNFEDVDAREIAIQVEEQLPTLNPDQKKQVVSAVFTALKQGVTEASVYKKDQDLSSVPTEELEAFVNKHWLGGIPTYGQGESVKRAMRELRRRKKQGVTEANDPSAKIQKQIEKIDAQIEAAKGRLGMARDRRVMAAQRGKGSGRIESSAETRIRGKIDALNQKKYELKSQLSTTENFSGAIAEKEMTPSREKERERIVKGMKKSKADLKDRYGDDWENVMYATATKRALGEQNATFNNYGPYKYFDRTSDWRSDIKTFELLDTRTNEKTTWSIRVLGGQPDMSFDNVSGDPAVVERHRPVLRDLLQGKPYDPSKYGAVSEESLSELHGKTLRSYADKRMASFDRTKGIAPGSKEHKQWKMAQKAYDQAAKKSQVPSQAREDIDRNGIKPAAGIIEAHHFSKEDASSLSQKILNLHNQIVKFDGGEDYLKQNSSTYRAVIMTAPYRSLKAALPHMSEDAKIVLHRSLQKLVAAFNQQKNEAVEESFGDLVKRFKRGREADRKSGEEWAKASDAEKRGDKAAADKHFRRHTKYHNLTSPNQWTTVKEDEQKDPVTIMINKAAYSKVHPQHLGRFKRDAREYADKHQNTPWRTVWAGILALAHAYSKPGLNESVISKAKMIAESQAETYEVMSNLKATIARLQKLHRAQQRRGQLSGGDINAMRKLNSKINACVEEYKQSGGTGLIENKKE